jgi:hypothetical protein
MLEEDEQIQDSDIAIRQKSAQLDSIRVEDDEALGCTGSSAAEAQVSTFSCRHAQAQ